MVLYNIIGANENMKKIILVEGDYFRVTQESKTELRLEKVDGSFLASLEYTDQGVYYKDIDFTDLAGLSFNQPIIMEEFKNCVAFAKQALIDMNE